ncbi:uncharacterized protein V1477_014084 [Vespula maculifrons]|uniref:Uncharacterized protein n=1 Tax=Vespula maculifrons TaxID=7453 RepID=A0ABD2BLX8_VESMC
MKDGRWIDGFTSIDLRQIGRVESQLPGHELFSFDRTPTKIRTVGFIKRRFMIARSTFKPRRQRYYDLQTISGPIEMQVDTRVCDALWEWSHLRTMRLRLWMAKSRERIMNISGMKSSLNRRTRSITPGSV